MGVWVGLRRLLIDQICEVGVVVYKRVEGNVQISVLSSENERNPRCLRWLRSRYRACRHANLTNPNAVIKGGSGCLWGAPPPGKCKSF